MRTFTRWILDHRWLVAGIWAIVAVAAFASLQPASDALSSEFSLPGRESTDANVLIAQRYGTGGPRANGPIVPVAQLPQGTTVDSPGVRRQIEESFAEIAAAVPGARAANFGTTGDRAFVSDDGRTTFGVIWYTPAEVAFDPAGESLEAAREAAADVRVAGAPVLISGIDALSSAEEGSEGPSVLIETLIGGVFALIVLTFVFGSAMALVPIATCGLATPTT